MADHPINTIPGSLACMMFTIIVCVIVICITVDSMFANYTRTKLSRVKEEEKEEEEEEDD